MTRKRLRPAELPRPFRPGTVAAGTDSFGLPMLLENSARLVQVNNTPAGLAARGIVLL